MSLIAQQTTEYLNYLQSYLSPDTVADYRKRLDVFLNWAGFRESFEENDLINFQLSLSHLKPSSQKSYISTVRNFFLWLYDTGRANSNPAVRLKVKVPKNVPVSFSPNTVQEILSTFQEDFMGIRNKALVSLAYSACLRRAEILALTMGDLDLAKREVHVRNGKMNQERKAVFSLESLQHLQDYLVIRHEHLAGEPSPYLWITLRGKQPLGYNSIDTINRKVRQTHGNVDLFSLHKLRHSMATQMTRHTHNGNLGLVAKHLGHTELNTAYQHYIDLNISDLQKILEDEQ